jgi:hypothetical protein
MTVISEPSGLLLACKKSAQLVETYLNSEGDEIRRSGQKQVRLSISIVEEIIHNHE